MAPTSIDGTEITGATIDGQDVSEITVDGETVFTAIPDIVDNFEDLPDGPYDTESVSDFYNGDTGSASRVTSNVISGTHSLEKTTKNTSIYSTSGLPNYPQKGDVFEAKIDPVGTNADKDFGFILFGMDSSGNGYGVCGNNFVGDAIIRTFSAGNRDDTLASATSSLSDGEQHRMVVEWQTDNTIVLNVFDTNDNLQANVSATDSTFSNQTGVGFFSGGGGSSSTVFFDDYVIQ